MTDQTNSHHSLLFPPRLGLGASGAWSKWWFSGTKANRLVARALERGVIYFDTASFYANGLAEIRLGEALPKPSDSSIEISTKTGTRYQLGKPPAKDFSDESIRHDVEQSLRRLKRERLDILYLHGPNNAQIERALDTLAALKLEGKIKLAGVCGFRPALDFAVKSKKIDIIMGKYNILDTTYAPEFEAAKACGMRTVGIASLVAGLGNKQLSRPKSFADIWYLLRAVKHRQPQMTQARLRLHEIVKRHGYVSAEHVMLGFALGHSNIDTILTNTTRLSHLDANIETAQAPSLSKALLADLEDFAASLVSAP